MKITKKSLVSILIMLSMVLCLVSCGTASVDTSGENKTDTDDGQRVKIGISFDSFVIERWVRDRDIFVSTAESYGAEVNVQSANGNVDEQKDQLKYLMDDGVDVLVIIAVDCESLEETVREAKSRGIKVIAYDRMLLNSDADLYISFDNEQVGYLMGKTFADNLESGDRIVRIEGPLTDNNVKEVDIGFEKAIKNTGIETVYMANCDSWNANLGYGYIKEALAKNTDVKGVMCGNDDIATQVYKALSELRLSGKVLLTGQDGDLLACQRVVEGTQTVTVFKSIEEEAKKAAECAVALAEGQELPNGTTTISDGTYDISYLELQPTAVTKDNIDEVIIDGGYHARNEVYLED